MAPGEEAPPAPSTAADAPEPTVEAAAAATEAPDSSGAAKAEPAAGAAARRRNTGDLAEVMRRRRTACEEYESVPTASTADVAAPVAEAEPDGSLAAEGVGQAEGAAEPAEAAVQRRATGRDGGSRKNRSDVELQSWMKQMRGRCQVLESEQVGSIADAQCADVRTRDTAEEESGEAPAEAREAAAEAPSKAPHSVRSTSELRDWMARMRARCETLESTPQTTTADAVAEPARSEGDSADEPAPLEAPAEAGPGPPEQPPPAEKGKAPEEPEQKVDAAEVLAWRLRLRDGTTMSASERLKVWPSLLGSEGAAPQSVSRALPALVHLLGSSGGADVTPDEELLFDSGAVASSSRLATSFSEKYVAPLAPLPGQAGDEAYNAPVYSALAQLLRYHFPASAAAIEVITHAAGFNLAEVLGVVCGGPSGMAQCMLTPHGSGEADALLHFCDLVVMEDEAMLLLLTAVVLLAEVRPARETSYEEVKELIRGKEALGGLGARGCKGVCQCVAAARGLLEATPVSVSNSLAAGDKATGRLRLPMCAVSPDEALHHIYEKPPGSWRLVIVDVRMRASTRALPLCLRLGRAAHNVRRQMLRDLPYEESIHLCLLGDGPPVPGDDAYELCRHLVSYSVGRKHVSLVDGGWPEVEELADSLRLHLMPLDQEEEPVPAPRPGLREARAAVAEATAVGQKVAKGLLKGARSATLHFLRADGRQGEKAAAAAHAEAEKKAEAEAGAREASPEPPAKETE